MGLPPLTGFENHQGITHLGPTARPFAQVRFGNGNGTGDGTEGAFNDTVFGTYMHGPVLARNPQIADLLRMLELFAGMPFHAFFGIALMMASTPMVTTFQDPPASLGVDALSDQNAAGGIAWAFSEVPSVLVLIALLFQWYASDQRQARRKDRAAYWDGDKELEAYNAYLASLNARGSSDAGPRPDHPGVTPGPVPYRSALPEPGHHGGNGMEEGVAMPGTTNGSTSTKTMGVLTVGGLVAVTAYTVALGSNGWLWFIWVVLGLLTLGMVAARSS
ncbi:Lipid II isoglutaminyl synthase (glutamine-hydrolyzing) subunit GatD [Streptomyces griseoloalbus]